MKDADINNILSGLVRVGVVTDVDLERRYARVHFKETGITSGWLAVLDTHPHIPDYDPAVQRTEYASGGSGDAEFASHCHRLNIKQWMPRVNDDVLCIYLPVFNADGFILGGVH